MVPPVFEAVILYSTQTDNSEGVPLSNPESELIDKPSGSSISLENTSTSPPVEAGVTETACPNIHVRFTKGYSISGGTSTTAMLRATEPDPPLLLAKMVYVPSVVNTVGVPEI